MWIYRKLQSTKEYTPLHRGQELWVLRHSRDKVIIKSLSTSLLICLKSSSQALHLLSGSGGSASLQEWLNSLLYNFKLPLIWTITVWLIWQIYIMLAIFQRCLLLLGWLASCWNIPNSMARSFLESNIVMLCFLRMEDSCCLYTGALLLLLHRDRITSFHGYYHITILQLSQI